MPTYFARKAGNINAADVWATTPSGTAAAVTFAAGDVLMANSFAITVNVSIDLGATGEVRNDNTASATAGGSFTLNDGVTLTANIFAGSTATPCVNQTGTASGTIVGNSRGGTSANGGHGISKSSTGTLTLTGNITGGTTALQHGASISAGTTNFTGNIVGGNSGSGGVPASSGFVVSGGTLNVLSGTVTGGTVNNVYGLYVSGGSVTYNGTVTGPTQINTTTAHAIFHAGINTLTINGSVTGGAGGCGVANSVGGTVAINGTVTGGSLQPGCLNSSTGVITATRVVGNAYGPGNTSGLASVVGASNAGLGVIEIQQLEYGTFGQSPTSGTGIRLKKVSSNVAVFNYADTAGAKTLIDATQNAAMPAATDVRNGVSYASGALSGSCAVPAASSVAFGVSVDNTTGTALLTGAAVAASVWGAATRSITGGTVDTLTNPPTVPTVVQIRQEMDSNSTKLANLDTTVSSRLAPSGTLATVTTLTNAPTSVTPSDIWSHATRTITGGTVDTLTNAPSVPSAASIRAEIDSNSTQLAAIKAKTDNLPASPAATGDIPTAAQNATAVWSKPANELTVADSIGERAKQQSTVAITGAQLAAALS